MTDQHKGGHTAGPMRLCSAIETAANAARRWRDQYQHWGDGDKFSDGRTKGEQSDALNRAEHTPESIARILNDGWAYPICNCCGRRWNVVVEMQSEWGEETRQFCLPCLDAATLLAAQVPDARTPIARATGAAS